MGKRFVSIWFRHLVTDWHERHKPEIRDIPFVTATLERGRMVVKAVNIPAEQKGISVNMVVADGKAILPELLVLDDEEGQVQKLLTALGEWCIRYTPIVAVDMPDGLVLDVSGCCHLWKGEETYLKDIWKRLFEFGYDVKVAMADTIGTAWAIARYSSSTIIASGNQLNALLELPPAALRIDTTTVQRLEKLGLYQISAFISMPRRSLSRRFGTSLLTRIDQSLGQEAEFLEPIQPLQFYQERLACLEPIRTAIGIEIGDGIYSEGPRQALDFNVPYIKAIFGFFGVSDVTVFRAEGLNLPIIQDTALQKGIESIVIA